MAAQDGSHAAQAEYMQHADLACAVSGLDHDSSPQPRRRSQRGPCPDREDAESNEYDRSEENIELELSATPNHLESEQPAEEQQEAGGTQHEDERNSLRRLPTTTSQSEQRHLIGLRKFWRRNVSVAVPHKYCRDHLALERTFLGYLRTSLTLSMIAIFIVQFYPLQADGKKVERSVTFPKLAKPLASILVASSILTIVFGTVRFWRQQNAMVRGVIFTGTWELWGSALLILMLMLVLFITTLIAAPEVDDRHTNL